MTLEKKIIKKIIHATHHGVAKVSQETTAVYAMYVLFKIKTDDKQSQHLESTFLATLSTVRAPRVRAPALFSLQHWTGQRKCDFKKN